MQVYAEVGGGGFTRKFARGGPFFGSNPLPPFGPPALSSEDEATSYRKVDPPRAATSQKVAAFPLGNFDRGRDRDNRRNSGHFSVCEHAQAPSPEDRNAPSYRKSGQLTFPSADIPGVACNFHAPESTACGEEPVFV